MTIEIRPATEEELPQLHAVTAYSYANNDAAQQVAPVPILPEWTLCAFVDGRMATSFGAWPFRVRLNGASVAMAGVTMVATMPEFRRQGLLRRIMTQSFANQRDSGQPFAILRASLGAIYQRYGYAMATTAVTYEVDPRRLVFNDPVPASGRVRLHAKDEAMPVVMGIYRDFARPRNMMIQRAPALWEVRTSDEGGNRTRIGIYRTPAGEQTGYVVFQVVQQPGTGQVLRVADAAWLTQDAHRGIWDFFLSHDLVQLVRWDQAAEDDPTPALVAEPRDLNRRTSDGVWMRVTDVEQALRSRPYGTSGALTIAVRDTLCDWNDATFTLETTGPDRDSFRTEAHPDLVMPVASLASLLSGHRSATWLARAGLVEGEEKALDLADRLFATRYAPACPDGF